MFLIWFYWPTWTDNTTVYSSTSKCIVKDWYNIHKSWKQIYLKSLNFRKKYLKNSGFQQKSQRRQMPNSFLNLMYMSIHCTPISPCRVSNENNCYNNYCTLKNNTDDIDFKLINKEQETVRIKTISTQQLNSNQKDFNLSINSKKQSLNNFTPKYIIKNNTMKNETK